MKNSIFSNEERKKLLAVKGVGETVIRRLEQMGIHSLAQLAKENRDNILAQGSALTGSSCWQNSPQAKAAVQSAIQTAIDCTQKINR